MNKNKLVMAARQAAMMLVFCGFSAGPAVAGDAFVRAGLIFHPSDIGIEGRWRADLGADYAVNFSETVYVGFELQSSVFRQDVAESDRTATIFPANIFANVKYKSGNIGLRPYGGGGLGLLSTFILLSADNSWDKQFGFHLLGGIEYGRLSVELQMQRPFESGFDTAWALYAGLVF